MKLMSVTNNPGKVRTDLPTLSGSDTGWNQMPSLFARAGVDFLGIGFYELHKFYQLYLKFKPDLIVTEWIPAALVPVFFRQLGLLKCPVTLNWGDYYAEMIPSYPAWLAKHIDKTAPAIASKGSWAVYRPKWILRLLENYVAKQADFITTISRRNEARARAWGKQVHFIPLGYWPPRPTKIDLHSEQSSANHLKVVYVGTINRAKMVDLMIEGVRGLPCDLYLFGRPDPELQANAPANVHFMGYVDEREVVSVLQQADIVTSMNNQDCNYKFIEYIAARKPILTCTGLPANVFQHRETAYLAKDFREGLSELLQDAALRQKLAEQVAKIPIFTWDQVIAQYIKVYQEYLEAHPRS